MSAQQRPSADMTPNEISAFLIQLGRTLDGLVREYRDLGDAAAEAKRDAELAYARAYLETEGTVEERRQAAVVETSDARYMADLMDRKVAGCREAIRAVHARIEVGRTLSATTRDEAKLAGTGVHP